MDQFEEKELTKKKTFVEKTQNNWLINYIPQPKQNSEWCQKQSYESFFK